MKFRPNIGLGSHKGIFLLWGCTHFYNGCLNTKKLCHALWFLLFNNTKQENCAETQQKTPSMAFKDNALCCSHIQCSKIVALLCIYTVCMVWGNPASGTSTNRLRVLIALTVRKPNIKKHTILYFYITSISVKSRPHWL